MLRAPGGKGGGNSTSRLRPESPIRLWACRSACALRLFKLAVILFVVVFAVGGALFGPAVVTDLMAKNGTFPTTKRKLERLRNLALFRTPEQKRLLKAYDGPPPGRRPTRPRTYYTPKH